MGAKRPHTELYCHLVWATWDREPVIRVPDKPRLYGAIRAKLDELGCSDIEIGGIENHVHVVCRYPPALSVANLVQKIKGASSHFMTHEVAGMSEFQWQGGYGAFSFSKSALERVKEYVRNQEAHHADSTTYEHLERIFDDD
jgi:putative transposase